MVALKIVTIIKVGTLSRTGRWLRSSRNMDVMNYVLKKCERTFPDPGKETIGRPEKEKKSGL